METNLKAAPAWIVPDDAGVPSVAALGSSASRRRADHLSPANRPAPTMATREYRIPNLARACHVLRLFAASDEYLSSSAVARQLKMPRTTVLRILHTLAAERLLQRHGFDFTASPELRTGLRSMADTAVRAAAAPVLKELSQVTGETAWWKLATAPTPRAWVAGRARRWICIALHSGRRFWPLDRGRAWTGSWGARPCQHEPGGL